MRLGMTADMYFNLPKIKILSFMGIKWDKSSENYWIKALLILGSL